MKKIHTAMQVSALLAAILLPALGHAQIYPLDVYADAVRKDTKQKIKFMHNPSNRVYVGLCDKQKDGSTLCSLAKDGTYTTDTGITFRTRNMGQLFSADGKKRCSWDAAKLNC